MTAVPTGMPPDRMGFDVKACRATLVVALTVVVAMLPAWPAGAATRSTSFASPAAGDVLSDPVPIEVQVTWSGERPDHVDVRLVGADGGLAPDTESVRLTRCSGNCQDFALAEQRSTWSGKTFDPATLAPFATGSGPRCNGGYGMQVRPQGANWRGGIGVVVSRDPSAPTNVTATPSASRVKVSWQAAPEPDVTGYTLQRRRDDTASWSTVTEVGASTTTAVDADPPTGRVQYRVATFRGDGFDDDAPTSACADAERDLAAAAPAVVVQVPDPSSSPSEGGSGTPGGGGTSDPDDPDGASPDGGADDPDGAAGEDGEGGQDGEDGGSASPQPSPRRRAPATSVPSGSDADVAVPDIASTGRSTPEERFYGDGEGFSEELDFGNLDDDSRARASGEDVEGTVSLGDLEGMGDGGGLAMRRVLVPVAGGMIMLAFGLHLRRWTRDALRD